MKDRPIVEFDIWNEHKKEIHVEGNRPLFKEREVRWCVIGINIGNETEGKGLVHTRPVLIIKKLSADSCIAIPISSVLKVGSWFLKIDVRGKENALMLNQIRMISAKRLRGRICRMDEVAFAHAKEKLKNLLELF